MVKKVPTFVIDQNAKYGRQREDPEKKCDEMWDSVDHKYSDYGNMTDNIFSYRHDHFQGNAKEERDDDYDDHNEDSFQQSKAKRRYFLYRGLIASRSNSNSFSSRNKMVNNDDHKNPSRPYEYDNDEMDINSGCSTTSDSDPSRPQNYTHDKIVAEAADEMRSIMTSVATGQISDHHYEREEPWSKQGHTRMHPATHPTMWRERDQAGDYTEIEDRQGYEETEKDITREYNNREKDLDADYTEIEDRQTQEETEKCIKRETNNHRDGIPAYIQDEYNDEKQGHGYIRMHHGEMEKYTSRGYNYHHDAMPTYIQDEYNDEKQGHIRMHQEVTEKYMSRGYNYHHDIIPAYIQEEYNDEKQGHIDNSNKEDRQGQEEVGKYITRGYNNHHDAIQAYIPEEYNDYHEGQGGDDSTGVGHEFLPISKSDSSLRSTDELFPGMHNRNSQQMLSEINREDRDLLVGGSEFQKSWVSFESLSHEYEHTKKEQGSDDTFSSASSVSISDISDTYDQRCSFVRTKSNKWYEHRIEVVANILIDLIQRRKYNFALQRVDFFPHEARIPGATNTFALHELLNGMLLRAPEKKAIPSLSSIVQNDDEDIQFILLSALIEANPKALSSPGSGGYLPLHIACARLVQNQCQREDRMAVHLQVIRQLLISYPDAASDNKNETGEIPLHIVSHWICKNDRLGDVNNTYIAERIIAFLMLSCPEGASFRDHSGITPLDIFRSFSPSARKDNGIESSRRNTPVRNSLVERLEDILYFSSQLTRNSASRERKFSNDRGQNQRHEELKSQSLQKGFCEDDVSGIDSLTLFGNKRDEDQRKQIPKKSVRPKKKERKRVTVEFDQDDEYLLEQLLL